MKANQLTFGQSYLASKIAVIDKLLSGVPQHPSEFIDAWRAAQTALSVVRPDNTRMEIASSLRACFPQLNTRWHD